MKTHFFLACMNIHAYTSISDLIQPEGQKHIIPYYKLQQSINLHKIPPEKTSAALFIKGIFAQPIWRIFCTLPLDLLVFPLSAFFSLHWKSREKVKPWRCRLWPHAWSLRTYIQSSPAHEASDSHTQILDTAREGTGSVKGMFYM